MYKPQKKKNGKRLYQVIGMALLCVLVVYMSYTATTAWFLDESITSNGKPNIMIIGTVDLDVKSNFNFYNLSLQPDYTYTVDKEGSEIGTYVRTKADEQTNANIPSLPQAANADCRYSSFAPKPFLFLPALCAIALSRRLGFFDNTERRSCEICCGVRLRKHTIAIMRNIEAIIGSIIRNQLPSLRICLIPPVVHRTAGVFF